jgi:long-chain acyl-CoA synthetase
MAAETIVGRFQERVAGHPGRVALRFKSGGRWHEVTWRGYGDNVRRAAKGLLSLGFQPGDKVSVLSGNRPEWHFADVACLSAGGTTAPIYTTSSPEQVAYIVGHSDSKVAFVENAEQLEKVLKSRGDLPRLEKVIVFEGESEGDELVITWKELLAAGDAVEDSRYDEISSNVSPNDLATFVYTSGTTGPPKAVMLTHSNIWWTSLH